MSDNRFKDHIDAQRKIAQEKLRLDKLAAKYFFKASLDFRGSALTLLMDAEQAKLAREFLSFMGGHGNPNAIPIKLEIRLPAQPLSRVDVNNDLRPNKRHKLLSQTKWSKLWSGEGYLVGVICDPSTIFIKHTNSSLVYLCTDMRLRCRRSDPIFSAPHIYASGFGTIPNAEIPKYSFRTGSFVKSFGDGIEVVFKNESLENILLEITEASLIA